MRRLVLELQSKHQIGYLAASLPPHVTLKQPFPVSDLAGVETYFDGLARSLDPFRVALTGLDLRVALVRDEEMGILWLDVEESQTLRNLHNRINRELAERFEDTAAPFDGPEYHFHATVAMGERPPAVYRRAYDEYRHLDVPPGFRAREVAMFCSADEGRTDRFITYKILPLGGSDADA
jgi:2'-5' RNA ligase